jgi:hypothetical protein
MAVTNGNATNGSSAKHNLPSHFIGGNSIESAAPSNVKDFVIAHDGHSVITSVSNLWNNCNQLQCYSIAILRFWQDLGIWAFKSNSR